MLNHFACYMIEGIQSICYVKHAEDSFHEEVCIFGLSDLLPPLPHTHLLPHLILMSTEVF